MKKLFNLFIVVILFTMIVSFFLPKKVAAFSSEPVVTIFNGNPDENHSYYKNDNFQWQAIASVESTGSRLWASWMRGGTTEPDSANYIVLAYSDDLGETWVDPYLVIDDDNSTATRMRDPVLWQDNTGVLWLFFGFKGTYAVRISNPDGDVSNISVGFPEYMFAQTIMNKPIITSWGEWMVNVDPFLNSSAYRQSDILISTTNGDSWEVRGHCYSTVDVKKWHEGTLVEKKDGTLWLITRIEQGNGGGLEQCFSNDHGQTWTSMEYNLDAPFRGPGSKCAIYRLKSGSLIFVTNASTSARIDMTAYISTDDGKTWKGLLLDDRLPCAYPDICEDNNGNIYVVWDQGRMDGNEIRLARFTEADALKGVFYTENAKNKISVSKSNKYSDIVKLNTTYQHVFEYTVGDAITKEEIIALLPTSINFDVDNGENYTLNGTWKIGWFSNEKAGVYVFKFNYNKRDLATGVSDNLGLFDVKVIVNAIPEEPQNGCLGSISLGIMLPVMLIGSIVLLRKKEGFINE